MKLIYNRVYAKLRNQVFFDLDSLNRAIAEKVTEHNQTRMQRKPWCRNERFLAEEKPLLLALPPNRFELKYYRNYKVAQNNHVYLGADKHYYCDRKLTMLVFRKIRMYGFRKTGM